MDPAAYLRRIGYSGPLDSTSETLFRLQYQHLLTVPFENLDIHYRRSIVLDEARMLHKVVDERRGGFCYELNGAFALLLESLRFKVSRLSARVYQPDGTLSPEFDHLCLLVETPEPFLADVGFGESSLRPLALDAGSEVHQGSSAYRLVREGERWVVQQKGADGGWAAKYDFSLQPRALEEFAGMCQFHQTSPESHFTRKRLCTRATPEGRITLSDLTLIITREGNRSEIVLRGEREFHAALLQHFGIDLPVTSGALRAFPALG